MNNIDKELIVPKWVPVVWPKIPPNVPESTWRLCLPKPKSSGISRKKASLGVRSPWYGISWLATTTYIVSWVYFVILQGFFLHRDVKPSNFGLVLWIWLLFDTFCHFLANLFIFFSPGLPSPWRQAIELCCWPNPSDSETNLHVGFWPSQAVH